MYQPRLSAFYVAKIERIGYTSYRNLEMDMRAIKVLCVISALFLMGTSDVSAKSANNTVIKETTNNKIKDEDESIKKTRTSIQGLGNNALQIINRPGITSSQVCAEFKTLLENNLAI